MRKIAIFTEGQTEQIFAEFLLREIVGTHGLVIESYTARGGGKSGARSFRSLSLSGPSNGATHFAMIVDCGTDNRVRSDIGDQYDSLIKSGYTTIIGIRDVFPEFTVSDIPKLRSGLNYRLKSVPIQVQFILGVMEIESWFLAEHTHFSRIDPTLTVPKIIALLGFNPELEDLQLRINPASDLHMVYQIAGLAYRKKKNQALRTMSVLDYASIYLDVSSRFPDLHNLIKSIDDFIK